MLSHQLALTLPTDTRRLTFTVNPWGSRTFADSWCHREAQFSYCYTPRSGPARKESTCLHKHLHVSDHSSTVCVTAKARKLLPIN